MLSVLGSGSGDGETDPYRLVLKGKGAGEEQGELALAPRETPPTVVIIERNAFLRDCLQRSAIDGARGRAIGYASLADLAPILPTLGSAVVLLSTISLKEEEKNAELQRLSTFDPLPQTMVLANSCDLGSVSFALDHGAHGYISIDAGLAAFVQALRFVAAGGTYVPPQCLAEAKKAPATGPTDPSGSPFTNREMAVIQAIRRGKPNKVIAFELNMCESTVKVHVRNIMKKLHAKNRTDVAIKSSDLTMPAPRR